MKRLLVPMLAFGVLLSVTSACGNVGSNVAATVGGKEITVDQVTALSKQLATLEKQAVPSGALLSNSLARSALSEHVALLVAQQELSRRKASVTSTDRQSASSNSQSFSSLPKVVQDELSAFAALTRVVGSDTKSPEIKKLAEKLFAQVKPSQRKQICADAIAGDPANADAVQKLLDAGTSLTDPTAFQSDQYETISSNGPYCANPAQLPSEIQKPWATAPKGVLQRVAFTSTGSDGSSQNGVIFFKVTGTSTLTVNDPAIIRSVQQEIQSNPNLVLAGVFKKADIHIDPRFGSGFNLSTGVTPPQSPVVPTTKPKPVKVPSTEDTIPAGTASTSTTPTG